MSRDLSGAVHPARTSVADMRAAKNAPRTGAADVQPLDGAAGERAAVVVGGDRGSFSHRCKRGRARVARALDRALRAFLGGDR